MPVTPVTLDFYFWVCTKVPGGGGGGRGYLGQFLVVVLSRKYLPRTKVFESLLTTKFLHVYSAGT